MELSHKQIRKVGRIKTTCAKCDGPLEENRVGKTGYCKKCHAAYMRATRPKHSELAPLARMKANARAYAHVCVKRGQIKKEPCVVCGAEAQMHHPDYSKPREVVWVCRDHHLQLFHA